MAATTNNRLSAAQRETLRQQDARYLPEALPAAPGWEQLTAHVRHAARLLTDRQASSPSARVCGHINTLYDRSVTAAPSLSLACKQGCAHCCHQPVVLYGPEAFFLAAHVRNRPDMAARVLRVAETAGKFPLGAYKGVTCSLLEDDACSLYAARPLSCRAFVSLDVNDCIGTFHYFNQSRIRTPKIFESMRDLCRLILLASIKAAGLPVLAYELNTTVAAILGQDNAEKRWLRGEDILAGQEKSAPLPPEFVAAIDRLSAGVAGTL